MAEQRGIVEFLDPGRDFSDLGNHHVQEAVAKWQELARIRIWEETEVVGAFLQINMLPFRVRKRCLCEEVA